MYWTLLRVADRQALYVYNHNVRPYADKKKEVRLVTGLALIPVLGLESVATSIFSDHTFSLHKNLMLVAGLSDSVPSIREE